jgi:toxin ParE1/3/4
MKIFWTDPSIVDLDSIRDYIGKDSKFYANQFVERIVEAVEPLQKFPKMGRKVPEADDENIREILFQNYRIMYRIEANQILILTILHGARDMSQKKFKPWEIS